MAKDFVKDLANSESAVESIKRLRPSSLFLLLLVIFVPILIRCLFSDIPGYYIMVWVWFSMAVISMIIAIFAYFFDMSAFVKRNNYEEEVK